MAWTAAAGGVLARGARRPGGGLGRRARVPALAQRPVRRRGDASSSCICSRAGPARGSCALVSAPLLLSAAAVAIYHWTLYGFFDPRLVYGRRPEFSAGTLLEGVPGLMLDQEFGLLVYAPFLALSRSRAAAPVARPAARRPSSPRRSSARS